MPFWNCFCARVSGTEPKGQGETVGKDKAVPASQHEPTTVNGIPAVSVPKHAAEPPTELAQALHRSQEYGSMNGHSLEQLQVLYDKDQRTILQALSASVQVRCVDVVSSLAPASATRRLQALRSSRAGSRRPPGFLPHKTALKDWSAYGLTASMEGLQGCQQSLHGVQVSVWTQLP